MWHTDFKEYFAKIFLFSNVETETLVDISEKITPQLLNFSAKEIIYSPNGFSNEIGFVLEGVCVVERVCRDDKTIPLNKITVNDSFGILAVFGKTETFPTRIKTLTNSKILFLSEKDILYLINTYPVIAQNIIYYLAQKIVFLNSKIATFSSDTVEQKLASYIINERNKQKSDLIVFNCKKSAETINVGRASLYRAISSLTESGCIKLENKKIYINDIKCLERILK